MLPVIIQYYNTVTFGPDAYTMDTFNGEINVSAVSSVTSYTTSLYSGQISLSNPQPTVAIICMNQGNQYAKLASFVGASPSLTRTFIEVSTNERFCRVGMIGDQIRVYSPSETFSISYTIVLEIVDPLA